MSETGELQRQLTKRLLPLYVAAFFQSLVLWYSVEKLFMRSIGFDNAGIGLMIAVYSAVMLAVETPSGILADRWSRKGVLVSASICLGLSGLVGGLSHGISTYLIAAVLWGVFFACYSGLYDSIVYDTITEAGGSSKLFDSLYGRVQLVESLALIIGGLAGGFIAGAVSLRSTYFLTIPFILLPILALWKFREPTLHKKQMAQPLKQQLRSTLGAILKNPPVTPVVIVLILQVALIYSLYEFAQLWLLAAGTSTKYYGIAYAVLLLSYGVGGVAVSRLRLSRYWLALTTALVMIFGCLGLIVFRSTFTLVAAQFMVGIGLVSMGIIFRRLLHDSLGASIRAGAASAASTIGRIFIIPLVLVFGYLSQHFTVYRASYLLLVLIIIMAFFILVVAKRDNQRGLESS